MGRPPTIIFAPIVRPYNFVPDSFHTAITTEALRAKIDRKSAISVQRRPVDPIFQVEGVAPPANHSSQKTRINVLSYGI